MPARVRGATALGARAREPCQPFGPKRIYIYIYILRLYIYIYIYYREREREKEIHRERDI